MSCLHLARHGHNAAGRPSSAAVEIGTVLGLVLAMLVAMAIGAKPAAAQSGGGFFSFFQSKPAQPPARIVRLPMQRRLGPVPRAGALARTIRVGPHGRILDRGGYRIMVAPDGSRRIFKPFAEASGYRGYADYSDHASSQSIRPQGGQSGGYRTVCVRLCDGFYFPLSHGVSSGAFRRDRNRCDAACGNAAAMFVSGSGNDDIAHWRDLNGKAYGSLANAFRYRRERVSGCQCKPESWSRESRIRHARFAAVEDGSSLRDVRVREAKVIDNPSVRVTPLQIVPARAVPSGEGSDDNEADLALAAQGRSETPEGAEVAAAAPVTPLEDAAEATEAAEAAEIVLAGDAADDGNLPESWRATDPLLSAGGADLAATGGELEGPEAERRAALAARRANWRLEQGRAAGLGGYPYPGASGYPRFIGQPGRATPAISGARPLVAPVKAGATSKPGGWRRNWQAARD